MLIVTAPIFPVVERVMLKVAPVPVGKVIVGAVKYPLPPLVKLNAVIIFPAAFIVPVAVVPFKPVGAENVMGIFVPFVYPEPPEVIATDATLFPIETLNVAPEPAELPYTLKEADE